MVILPTTNIIRTSVGNTRWGTLTYKKFIFTSIVCLVKNYVCTSVAINSSKQVTKLVLNKPKPNVLGQHKMAVRNIFDNVWKSTRTSVNKPPKILLTFYNGRFQPIS